MLNERDGCLVWPREVPRYRECLRMDPRERGCAVRCGPPMKSFSREWTNGLLVGRDAECNGLLGFRLAAEPLPAWRFPRFSSSCARRVNSEKVDRRNWRSRGPWCGLLLKGAPRIAGAAGSFSLSLSILSMGTCGGYATESADPAERVSHSGAFTCAIAADALRCARLFVAGGFSNMRGSPRLHRSSRVCGAGLRCLFLH